MFSRYKFEIVAVIKKESSQTSKLQWRDTRRIHTSIIFSIRSFIIDFVSLMSFKMRCLDSLKRCCVFFILSWVSLNRYCVCLSLKCFWFGNTVSRNPFCLMWRQEMLLLAITRFLWSELSKRHNLKTLSLCDTTALWPTYILKLSNLENQD